MPVLYLSELLALAYGHEADEIGLGMHRVSADAFLETWGVRAAGRARAAASFDLLAAREVRRLPRLQGRLPRGQDRPGVPAQRHRRADPRRRARRSPRRRARPGSASSASPASSCARRASVWRRPCVPSRSSAPPRTSGRTCSSKAYELFAARGHARQAARQRPRQARPAPAPGGRRRRPAAHAGRRGGRGRRRRGRERLRRRARRRRKLRGRAMSERASNTRPQARPATGARPAYREEAAYKIHGGCGLIGVCDESGGLLSADIIMRAMAVQHDRGNGLGGGFAGYGIYPAFPDHYCLQLMYHDEQARTEVEGILRGAFAGRPCRADPHAARAGHRRPAHLWRYFVMPDEAKLEAVGLPADDLVVRVVMDINAHRGRRLRGLLRQEHGRLQGRGLPRGDRRLLPPRGVRGPHVARPQPLSHQHSGLVGRRAPVRPARLVGRAQRRDLSATASTAATSSSSATAARWAPTPRWSRTSSTSCCAATSCRSSSPAPRWPARCGARSTACRRTSSEADQGAAPGLRLGHAQRAVRHRARLQRRHGGAERPHQAAPAGRRAPGLASSWSPPRRASIHEVLGAPEHRSGRRAPASPWWRASARVPWPIEGDRRRAGARSGGVA